ncbi:hypothetical protein RRG08_001089 [Elysia crispata]|uniref:Uncharacterized protein n=1 Tax=Elysia crispata TaxID=231223 RepID=A0AAE1AW07_9GAST|nr:hypothetical protein RRG08_001089 [Elysia crispata]
MFSLRQRTTIIFSGMNRAASVKIEVMRDSQNNRSLCREIGRSERSEDCLEERLVKIQSGVRTTWHDVMVQVPDVKRGIKELQPQLGQVSADQVKLELFGSH